MLEPINQRRRSYRSIEMRSNRSSVTLNEVFRNPLVGQILLLLPSAKARHRGQSRGHLMTLLQKHDWLIMNNKEGCTNGRKGEYIGQGRGIDRLRVRELRAVPGDLVFSWADSQDDRTHACARAIPASAVIPNVMTIDIK